MTKRKVAILIPVRNDKFLILKRADWTTAPGLWNFPGGEVDKYEYPFQAAARELEEEANLWANENKLDYFGQIEQSDKILYFYGTKKSEGEAKINNESSDMAWITIEELDNYDFIPLGKWLVSTLKEYIAKG